MELSAGLFDLHFDELVEHPVGVHHLFSRSSVTLEHVEGARPTDPSTRLPLFDEQADATVVLQWIAVGSFAGSSRDLLGEIRYRPQGGELALVDRSGREVFGPVTEVQGSAVRREQPPARDRSSALEPSTEYGSFCSIWFAGSSLDTASVYVSAYPKGHRAARPVVLVAPLFDLLQRGSDVRWEPTVHGQFFLVARASDGGDWIVVPSAGVRTVHLYRRRGDGTTTRIESSESELTIASNCDLRACGDSVVLLAVESAKKKGADGRTTWTMDPVALQFDARNAECTVHRLDSLAAKGENGDYLWPSLRLQPLVDDDTAMDAVRVDAAVDELLAERIRLEDR